MPARPRALERARAHRSRGRLVALAVAAALAVVPAVGLTASPAAAVAARAFAPVFSANTNGSILMAANTLMTCKDPGTGGKSCAVAQSATSGTGINNNHFNGQYVDVDANPATFNSSSATLTVPAGGSVLFALLVWGGRTTTTPVLNADAALRGNALFTTPAGPGALGLPVTATQVDEINDSNGVAYQATLDVTALVQAAGSGTYTLANVQSSAGGVNNYAGWSLVVAVADPSAPARNLTVFSGFATVRDTDPNVTLTVSGFLTPPSGPVRTTLGAITYEGDLSSTGDAFRLNGTSITDALNPADNAFNSSISQRGTQVGGRNPGYTNQLGFDAPVASSTSPAS